MKPPGASEKVKAFLHNDEYSIRYRAERTLRDLGLGYDDIDVLKKEK